MVSDAVLRDLNPAQRQAVLTQHGPLLVLAGAGTGKTRVVTYRIARLMDQGIPGDRILAVTFTKKAAQEMRQRVGQLLGRSRTRQPSPEISTFHSLCVRILRRHIQHLGYPQDFAIYNRADQEGLARRVLREIRVSEALLQPSDLLYFISRWKASGVSVAEAAALARTDKEHLAAAGYRRCQAALKAAGAVDFDDLLLCTEELFRQSVPSRREEAARFDQILVDEYQDTNASQYRIVKALAAKHRNLCVVGDDDQSIYGWRGAEIKHILRFRDDWPEATVVRLEANYRSSAAILELANRLIACNRVRHEKVLRATRPGGARPRIEQFDDETLEAERTVADIRRLIDARICEPRDVAILFRTNEQPRVFESELRRARVPYLLIGGQSYFDRKEVRDLTAYLRVLANPDDDPSLRRIINVPPRGITRAAVQRLSDQAVRSGRPLWQTLEDSASRDPNGAAVGKFVQLIQRHRQASPQPSLAARMKELLCDIAYDAELARQYDDPEQRQSRQAAVEEFVNALADYEEKNNQPTLQGFLDEITLSTLDLDRHPDKSRDRNAVALMTLHSAKGLEFPHVYMVGMEEGLLPHRRSLEHEANTIDEERRLCYVGLTRAQQHLTLSLALTRRKWGKPRASEPSRFLFEIIGKQRAMYDGLPRPS